MKKTTLHFAGLSLLVLLFLGGYIYFKKGNEGNKIRIGVILPLSGDNQRAGKFIRDAFDMGVNEINKNGGVNGKVLVAEIADDAGDPSKAGEAMNRFASNSNISVVFGSWSSSCVVKGQAPIATDRKMPVLAMAQSPKITGISPYVARIQPSSELYLKVLVPYAMDKIGINKFHIVYIENDYGVGLEQIFSDLCKKAGGQIVSTNPYRDGEMDFKGLITRLKAQDPTAGVFLAMYSEAGYFLDQAAKQEYAPQFFGAAPMENPDIIATAKAAANGVIYAHHYDPQANNPKLIQFISDYRNQFGEQPEGFAALGYDAAHVLAEALKIGQSRESINAALHSMKYDGVTGEYLFDKNGDVAKPIYIRKIVDQKFVTVLRPPTE